MTSNYFIVERAVVAAVRNNPKRYAALDRLALQFGLELAIESACPVLAADTTAEALYRHLDEQEQVAQRYYRLLHDTA